jgi:major membrane immunogen (membrane-anchored lipoprotein)
LEGIKMNSKKLISLALILIFVVSLAACGSNEPKATEPAAAPAPAEQPAPAPAPAPAADGLKDGSYKAVQDKYDDYGWKGQIAIEVKDGKISSVDFDYVNKDNKLKSEDAGYIKAMEDKTKVNLAEAMKAMESSLVGRKDADVAAVSGATTSSNDFKALAESALKDAK